MRLDAFLAGQYPDKSRAQLQRYIGEGRVSVDGIVTTKPSVNISDDNIIKVNWPEASDYTAEIVKFAQNNVIYRNDDVVVINKPAGMLTHSKGTDNNEFTVADFVKSIYNPDERDDSNNRQGIVHRLDRATSGVLIAALNNEAVNYLAKQFSHRKAHKTYLAILEHRPKLDQGRLDLPLARNPKRPATFRVDGKGKVAITDYRVMETFPGGHALVEFKPQTGRTHQLRIHAAYMGCPIIGDPLYGHGQLADRLYLHAYQLEITIIENGVHIRKTFTAELPADFQQKLTKLRGDHV